MTPLRRTTVVAAVTALSVAAAGCGSDSGGSGRPAYCDARDNLQQSLQDLKNVDLKGGASEIQAQVDKVQADAQTFAKEAQTEFEPEATALKSSVSALATAAGQAASSPSATTLAAVVDDISQVGTSFRQLSDAVSKKC